MHVTCTHCLKTDALFRIQFQPTLTNNLFACLKSFCLKMTQKVCVVFGFGPGIGAACARRWLNEGFKVAIIAR